MSLNHSPYYQELCSQMNPYLAVLQIAGESRCISKSLDNRIPSATALDYAARKELPDPKDYPDHRLDRVKEYLTYVDDPEIRLAVLYSYEDSIKFNNLKYVYNTIADDPRKARVRVIMNILWGGRPHKN